MPESRSSYQKSDVITSVTWMRLANGRYDPIFYRSVAVMYNIRSFIALRTIQVRVRKPTTDRLSHRNIGRKTANEPAPKMETRIEHSLFIRQ